MGDTPAEDDQERSDDTSKLELPSLTLPDFGRKKRKPVEDSATTLEPEVLARQSTARPEDEPATQSTSSAVPATTATTPVEPNTRPIEPAAPPVETTTPPVETEQPPAPASRGTVEQDDEPTTRTRWATRARQAVLARRSPQPGPTIEPAEQTAPVAEPAEPAERITPTVRAEPAPTPRTAPAAVTLREPTPGPMSPGEPDLEIHDETHDDPRDDDDETEEESSGHRAFALPRLPGRIAAVVTGLIVGLFGAVLTYLSLQACEVVRGTETCGGGPGLLLLVVILVLMVMLGGVLLVAWDAAESRGTSFLAVGVLCVIVLLTGIDEVVSPWMFLVAPVLSALAYLLAHWVTTTFVEPAPERGPAHDVR